MYNKTIEMSVFGVQQFLELKAQTALNSNAIVVLSDDLNTFTEQTLLSFVEVNNSIDLLNTDILANTTSIGNNLTDLTTLINTNVDIINTAIDATNTDIQLRLLRSDYDLLEIEQNNSISTHYLSKGEFNEYLINEQIKGLISAAADAIVNEAIDDLKTGVAILGTSFIAGTFTLGGQFINNVDAAFLNVDGRLIIAENLLVEIQDDITVINTALTTKADLSTVNLSNERYDLALTDTNLKFDDYYTSQDTDMLLSYKVNGNTFNILKTDVGLSNTKYEADILELQNRPSGDVTIDTNYISFSNIVLTGFDDRYTKLQTDTLLSSKVNVTDYNTNNTTLNNSIATKVNQTVYDTNNTNITNSIATKVNVTDYNTNNTNIANSIALKVDKSAYDLRVGQLDGRIDTVEGVSGSALALSTANAAGLLTANTAITGNTLAIAGINTFGLPSKVDNSDYNTYRTNVSTELTNRYTKTETDTALGLKADKLTTYMKTETDNLLTAKANQISTYTITETDTLLNAKLATTTFNTTIANYSTTTQMNTLLNSKANTTSVYTIAQADNLLLGKADKLTTYTKTEADTLLSAKASTTSVYTIAQADTLLLGKADKLTTYTKTEADTLLNAKLATTSFNTTIANYSTTTQINTLLNAKANTTTVYTKTEADTLLNAKLATTSFNTTIANYSTTTQMNTLLNTKASLSGANFTGVISTPTFPNVEAQLIALTTATNIPVVSDLQFSEIDFAQQFDGFMTNRNLDPYTLRLPFSKPIPSGTVINLTAEPIITRIGSGWAEYRFLNNMDTSGRGNYLTYAGADETVYKYEPLTDKSYIQFNDGMVETVLDPSTIQHTVVGNTITGVKTGLVLSFDLKKLSTTTLNLFSIGDYVKTGGGPATSTATGITVRVLSTSIQLLFSDNGTIRRTYSCANISSTLWVHIDIIISNINNTANDAPVVTFYKDDVLQTSTVSGSTVETLRLFTTDNINTNLLRIYPTISYLSELKIFLKPSLEETLIDDLAVQLQNPFAEYLLYDNQDTSGNQAHLSGTITSQGRDIDGRQWFQRGDLSVFVRALSRPQICPNGTGFTMSFDVKLFQTGTNASSVVFGVGSLINASYVAGTNPIGTGINFRILSNNGFQLIFCEPDGKYSQVHSSSSNTLSATTWKNITFRISKSSAVSVVCWMDGVTVTLSTTGQDINSFYWGWGSSDIYKFRIYGNYTDSPYLSNIKMWLTDDISTSDIVNRRLDAIDPPLTLSLVKQNRNNVDFRVSTINSSYMNFLTNYNKVLIRASLISKQNTLLTGALDLYPLGIEPVAWYKGTILAISDIVGGLPSPTTSANAVIIPDTTYTQAISFEKFTNNSTANVQFPIRDVNQFDVKDYSFAYTYLNDTSAAYIYDTILSIGFATVLDSPMPDETNFIRGLTFDCQNITGTQDVNVDIGTSNTITGLDYLTIPNVSYTLGGTTQFNFTISKTRLLTVYMNGSSASVQLTKPLNILGKYDIKIHQRKYTSGESFTNVKMWRKCVTSNRLSIETLNYDKTYKTLAPYIKPTKATPVLLYKNGTGLQNLAGTALTRRTGSSYFAIPYVSGTSGANSTKDGASCPISIPTNAYSIGILIKTTASVSLSHIVSFGNPNSVFSSGQSAYTVMVDNITGIQASSTRFHLQSGGVRSILDIILKGLSTVAQFVTNINNVIKKAFSKPPVIANDGGNGKVGFKKPSGTGSGSVVIEAVEGGKDIGLVEDLVITEPEVIVYPELPPTFATGTINKSIFVYRQTSTGLTNVCQFRYNHGGTVAENICVCIYKEGIPRMWFGNFEIAPVKKEVVKTFVEYNFNGDLNDSSERGITLLRTGTGTTETLYTDASLGAGYGYMKVLNPYTVSANIAPVTTFIPIASKTEGVGTGLRLFFKIKLNNTTSTSTPIFTIGKRPKVTDTGTETWANGNGNTSRGIMFRLNNSKLSYICIDANGNYTQRNGSGNYTGTDGLLSTSVWTSVEVVINSLIDTDNKLKIDLYFDNSIATFTSTDTTTSLDFSYSGGVDNNLLRFTGYAGAHNIADFKMYLTDNRNAETTDDALNYGATIPFVPNDPKLYLGVITEGVSTAINKTNYGISPNISNMKIAYSEEDLTREDMETFSPF